MQNNLNIVIRCACGTSIQKNIYVATFDVAFARIVEFIAIIRNTERLGDITTISLSWFKSEAGVINAKIGKSDE